MRQKKEFMSEMEKGKDNNRKAGTNDFPNWNKLEKRNK